MIKVIDNFLTPRYHKEILGLMEGDHFDWHFIQDISDKYGQEKASVDTYGFFHMICNNDGSYGSDYRSQYFSFFASMLYQIMDASNTTEILRARGDMVTYKGEEPMLHRDHVDYIEAEYLKHTSAVYYVNDASGDTVIYKERVHEWKEQGKNTVDKIITPKANRLVFFDGDLIHNGGRPYDQSHRIICNCNFL